MKRSEMVSILEQAINQGLYQDYQIDTESASLILEVLEQAGMQPPEIREFVEIPAHNILGAGFKVGHNVNKWEEE